MTIILVNLSHWDLSVTVYSDIDMPTTFPALELKQDGDVGLARIKQAAAKPTLKDIQTHMKKKTAPAVLTTYPYGAKRITIIGYVKGKESEISQHQLPPPCEAAEIYGSILLIAHASKTTWDTVPEVFTAVDYEAFYEKACSGELEEADDDEEKEDDEDVVVDDEEPVVEEDEEEEEVVAEDEEGEEAAEAVEEEEEEPVARVRVSRKIVKLDPQQLQFQFKSSLVAQTEIAMGAIESAKQRDHTYGVLKSLVDEHCDDDDIMKLEMGIYNASLEEARRRLVPLTWEHETFRWIYNMIAKRTISNFQPDSYVKNESLIQRWKEGEFSLDALGKWTPYELKPTHWKELKDQQFRREQRILEGNLSMATDRFRCSQCKKKMCSYYELQTRSADEPMTIFIRCLNCGKQWKQ